MLLTSGLSSLILSKIWNIADLDRDGMLTLLEFTIAFHLVKQCMEGFSLNGPVNPFLCIPDEESAIRACKEKMKIFDKESLLDYKVKEKEGNFVSNSHELTGLDFELLAEYLPQSIIGSEKEESDEAAVDENCNLTIENKFSLKQDTSSEVIERHPGLKNELTVDLENVFEMLDSEKGDDYSEGPKFIARPAACDRTEVEENQMNDNLPCLRKRTYFGKQLIFEDPVGSETIGDVEFEVDFESIISDIEKESVDEERRLPIARVLPIYKNLPAADEKPFEKKTTRKDNRKVDWNSLTGEDVKDKSSREYIGSDVGNQEKEMITNSMIATAQNAIWGASMQDEKRDVVSEKSSGENNVLLSDGSTQMKNTKSKTVDDNTVIDIVEQKRILLQNQQEERRKNQETIVSDNKSVNSLENLRPGSVSEKPFAKKKNAEMKKEEDIVRSTRSDKRQESQIRLNDDSLEEKSEIRVLNNQPSLTSKIEVIPNAREQIDENRSWIERSTKVSTTLVINNLNRGSKAISEDMIGQNSVDDEEEMRREAERREQILLGRIRFLEKKRQELFEQKQREMRSGNVSLDQKQDSELTAKDEVQQKNTTWSGGETTVANVKSNADSKSQQAIKYANVDTIETADISLGGAIRRRNESVNDEAERKRLALALQEKRKSEAELEKRRQVELREAEKRRLEQAAKEQEEREAAKERKRNFLENLEKLNQRVVSEQEETCRFSRQTKQSSLRFDPDSTPQGTAEKSSHLNTFTKQAVITSEGNDTKQEQKLESSKKYFSKERGIEQNGFKKFQNSFQCPLLSDETSIKQVKREQDEFNQEQVQLKEEEIRRENFKSNKELFMKKIQNEQEKHVAVVKRENSNKARPKSYYGGMFNRPVHQIINDSLFVHDIPYGQETTPDLVDEEALQQYRREQEIEAERERVSKLRHHLERETSYTVENVEKFWEVGQANTSQVKPDKRSTDTKQVKQSSNPKRRSLVETLTTEWNSFLDIMEDDNRRESETVKMRQEIRARRKSSHPTLEKTVQKSCPSSSDVERIPSNEIVKSRLDPAVDQMVESDMEVLAKQSGKVKQLVKSYKRLSAPNFLEQDVPWNTCLPSRKTDEDESIEVGRTAYSSIKTSAHARTQASSADGEYETKIQHQRKLIKESAPRRKPDMAHTWSNLISRQ